MRKKKEKAKHKAKGSSLEFISPLSLWTCISALDALGAGHSPIGQSTRVRYDPIDQDSYKFSIHEQYINARGQLTKQENGSTLVVCKAHLNFGVKVNTIIVSVVAMAIIILLILSGGGDGRALLFMVAGLAAYLAIFFTYFQQRDQLLEKVRRVLDIS